MILPGWFVQCISIAQVSLNISKYESARVLCQFEHRFPVRELRLAKSDEADDKLPCWILSFASKALETKYLTTQTMRSQGSIFHRTVVNLGPNPRYYYERNSGNAAATNEVRLICTQDRGWKRVELLQGNPQG